jgi:glycerol-3-phosphate dehydrogenase
VLGVELLFGLRHEGALDVDDLLDRRVRLGLVPAERLRAQPLANELLAAVPA